MSMDLRRTVTELCAEHRLDEAHLVERSGLDARRVRAIIEGRWLPSPSERDRIAAAFGLTRDDIVWGHRTSVEHIHGHGPQFGRSP